MEEIEHKPTTAELIAQKQSEQLNIESQLRASDYITLKELDGEDVSKYGNYKAHRKGLRAQYNQLEIEIEELQLQLDTELAEPVV